MIKRILALRYVCKKYDLKYKLKLFGDVGWIDPVDREICVSLFQKHFYQTLYHEVGHMIADRSLGFIDKYAQVLCTSRLKFNNKYDVFIRLEEEAKASKFSHRVTKTKDKTYLKRAWYTYTGSVAECINSAELETYISTIHKYNKYFEGK